MPGRTPTEAVEEFLGPIRDALSCIARGKVTTSPSGARSPQVGRQYQWHLNNGAGAPLRRRKDAPPLAGPDGLEFAAAMWWRVIEDPNNGPYRVTTTGYHYSLSVGTNELWALQWQPDGPSPVTWPHMHLGSKLLDKDAPVTPSAHLPTSRMTFETAIRWCFEFGAEPLHDDWQERLADTEGPHLRHRSWHTSPDP